MTIFVHNIHSDHSIPYIYDTIPLDKGTYKFELSDSNKTYYGSDISISSGKNSGDSSVKIVYEVINLTGSNSGNNGKQNVTLRYKQ